MQKLCGTPRSLPEPDFLVQIEHETATVFGKIGSKIFVFSCNVAGRRGVVLSEWKLITHVHFDETRMKYYDFCIGFFVFHKVNE